MISGDARSARRRSCRPDCLPQGRPNRRRKSAQGTGQRRSNPRAVGQNGAGIKDATMTTRKLRRNCMANDADGAALPQRAQTAHRLNHAGDCVRRRADLRDQFGAAVVHKCLQADVTGVSGADIQRRQPVRRTRSRRIRAGTDRRRPARASRSAAACDRASSRSEAQQQPSAIPPRST